MQIGHAIAGAMRNADPEVLTTCHVIGHIIGHIIGLNAVSGAHARGGTLADRSSALPNKPSNNFLPRLTSLLAVGATSPPVAPSCPSTSSTVTAD
jgi:hypothetical protein